jgi:hypothetical protein
MVVVPKRLLGEAEMAVVGVSATTMFNRHRGGINADWTSHTLPPEGKPDEFKTPMSILAISVINEVKEITDAAIVRAFVSEFTDAAGVHKGPFIGVPRRPAPESFGACKARTASPTPYA